MVRPLRCAILRCAVSCSAVHELCLMPSPLCCTMLCSAVVLRHACCALLSCCRGILATQAARPCCFFLWPCCAKLRPDLRHAAPLRFFPCNLTLMISLPCCPLQVLNASTKPDLIRATLSTLHAFLSWVPLGYIFESNVTEV